MKTDKIDTIDPLTYQSGKIPKSSTIRLQIWSSDHKFWINDELIFQSKGDIESFLTQPFRTNDRTSSDTNTIGTVSLWRDEYE